MPLSHTAEDDYGSLISNVSFTAESPSTMCTSLSITDDIVLESDESVTIVMETNDPRVSISEEDSRATVVISDNDDG